MDKQLFNLIAKETKRQQETLDLIPSENIAPPELLKILGSPLSNKYSEGYPGKRYYPGNAIYDEIEELAEARALQAFHLKSNEWSVNVQPYSGSPANQAIYFALAKPGDTLLGLELSHGGHLTHGHKVSFSGMVYNALHYGLNEKGFIDYENLEALAKKHSPKIIVSGATAYPRLIDFKRIGEIARSCGAYHVADISHIAGLVAASLHPSPFPHADVVMATTHKTLRGPRGAVIFSRPSIADAINKAVFPGLQGGPHNNVIAGIAWTFKAVATPTFKQYSKNVIKNAHALATELLKSGFKLVSQGTENHLLLIDLTGTNYDGISAERVLESVGILANRNSIPGDTKPFKPSGIRIGTPSLTSRGMGAQEMKIIAHVMSSLLLHNGNQTEARCEVARLAKQFPISRLK